MARRGKARKYIEGIVAAIVVIVPLGALALYLAYGGVFPTGAPSAPAPAATASVQVQPVALKLVDVQSLPKKVSTAEIVPFSFEMTNEGSAQTTYSYRVSVLWKTGQRNVIDLNSVTLGPGATKTIKESLKFEVGTEVAHITIAVDQPPTSISLTLPQP